MLMTQGSSFQNGHRFKDEVEILQEKVEISWDAFQSYLYWASNIPDRG